jgi:hypothetical protein
MGLSINAILASALPKVGGDAPVAEKPFKISCKEDLQEDGYNSDLSGDTCVNSDSDDVTPLGMCAQISAMCMISMAGDAVHACHVLKG